MRIVIKFHRIRETDKRRAFIGQEMAQHAAAADVMSISDGAENQLFVRRFIVSNTPDERSRP